MANYIYVMSCLRIDVLGWFLISELNSISRRRLCGGEIREKQSELVCNWQMPAAHYMGGTRTEVKIASERMPWI